MDEGRPDVLQEDEDHEENQQEAFEKGVEHLADRCREKIVDVDEIENFYAVGQRRNDVVDDLLAIRDDLACVGAGG